MRRPEILRGWRAGVGFVVLIGVALMGAGATAMDSGTQEMRTEPASTMTAPAMPMLSGGMPCALCYIAPAPGLQAYTGEGKEPEPLTWWVHALPTLAQARLTDTNSRDRVPIRIACCKWLD